MYTKYEKTNYNYNSDSTVLSTQRNVFIREALKKLIIKIAKAPYDYCIEKNFKNYQLTLQELSYILVISIKEFLVYSEENKEQIISEEKSLSDLEIIIKTNILKINSSNVLKIDFYNKLDDNLFKIYQSYDVVSKNPIIQFIYWSIKNIPRLCIDPNKDFSSYEVNEILKNYFDIVLLAISEYNKNAEKMTSSEIRNFLSSVFIDKILESEYYRKTFE